MTCGNMGFMDGHCKAAKATDIYSVWDPKQQGAAPPMSFETPSSSSGSF